MEKNLTKRKVQRSVHRKGQKVQVPTADEGINLDLADQEIALHRDLNVAPDPEETGHGEQDLNLPEGADLNLQEEAPEMIET